MNTMLESYDATFQRELPNLSAIEFPETYCADAAHRWGVAPYHYEDGYYIDAMKVLERIAEEVAPSSGPTLPRRRVPSEESRPGGCN